MSRRVPDRALCVALARWPVAERDAVRLETACAKDAPLREALAFTRRWGTGPLAVAVLQETVWERLPADLRAECEQLRRSAAAYSGLVVRTLAGTLARLEAAGCFAAVFKGPVMAQRLFGHRARRLGGDIDLLLPDAQLEPAVALLCADGAYVPRPPFDRAAVRAVSRSVTLDPVDDPAGKPEFDLHRTFAHRWICDLPPGTVEAQSVMTELAGSPVRTVSDALGALQATLHLAANGYAWRQAADLAGWDRVLADADRADVQALARAAGCEGIALHAFELVRAVFGEPRPHAPPPLPSPSGRARARAALLRELGAVPEALFTASPLRTGYVRALLRGLAADNRGDALAAMARAVVVPNPIDAGRPGAVWRRPFQVAGRLLGALGRTA